MAHPRVVAEEIDNPPVTIIGFRHLDQIEVDPLIWFGCLGSWPAGDNFMSFTKTTGFTLNGGGTISQLHTMD